MMTSFFIAPNTVQ